MFIGSSPDKIVAGNFVEVHRRLFGVLRQLRHGDGQRNHVILKRRNAAFQTLKRACYDFLVLLMHDLIPTNELNVPARGCVPCISDTAVEAFYQASLYVFAIDEHPPCRAERR